ncbi:MAG: hypothetical protein K8L97_02515 [Anaerolineae bacterium]|nr:hypothetical protein [Anaerolineae bacterium]
MQINKIGKFTISMLLVLTGTTYILAQTPTPAPSKTPALTPTSVVEVTGEPISVPDTQITTPYTQADLAVLTGNIQRPNGLYWYNDHLYTSCTGDWTVYDIDIQTGNTSQYIYGVKNAHTIYATSNDNQISLWIPDFQSNTLTNISQGVTKNIATDLNGPWGITPLDSNTFLITNLQSNTLISVTEDGQITELVNNLKSPTGVATQDGYVYVANTGSARRAIEWFSLSTITGLEGSLDAEELTGERILVSGLQNVTNITLAADNNLYFAYALGTRGVVGRINPDVCREQGGCSNEDVEIVLYSEMAAPLAGLTISPDMRLYIHSIFSPDIYWLQIGEAGTS